MIDDKRRARHQTDADVLLVLKISLIQVRMNVEL